MVTARSSRLLLWRLTRNRYTQALYNALGRVGVRVAKMDAYVLPADRTPPERSPGDVTFEVMPTSTVDSSEVSIDADLHPEDRVAFARVDEAVVGQVIASVRPVPVPELGRRAVREGAYLWELFVEPAHRNRGIATALVGRAVATAREQFGVEEAFGLVAVDNYPSQWVFETCEFVAKERITYYRVPGWERRVVHDL